MLFIFWLLEMDDSGLYWYFLIFLLENLLDIGKVIILWVLCLLRNFLIVFCSMSVVVNGFLYFLWGDLVLDWRDFVFVIGVFVEEILFFIVNKLLVWFGMLLDIDCDLFMCDFFWIFCFWKWFFNLEVIFLKVSGDFLCFFNKCLIK